MILDSTVLRAPTTDFIFPKADNTSRMSSQRSLFFEGFLDATDPSIQSINLIKLINLIILNKIDIVHSTVLRAAMTDFIFPKADNIYRTE